MISYAAKGLQGSAGNYPEIPFMAAERCSAVLTIVPWCHNGPFFIKEVWFM